ncbi:MAG: Trp biosynthesis-associated membrane protein [Marmoricola sp.]
MTEPAGPLPRRTFGTALLAGAATAALTAVGAAQTWYRAQGDAAGHRVATDVSGSDAAPLALALALVALAAWGVVLVTGTLARRVALVLALLASLGVVVAALVVDADPVARTALATKGAEAVSNLARRPWFFTTVVAGALQVLVVLASFRWIPTWPTMSSRYDAPSTAGTSEVDPEDADDLTLWKALDEGHDPTSR